MILFHVEMLQLEVALHFCVTVVEPREVARIHVRVGQTVIRPFLREIRLDDFGSLCWTQLVNEVGRRIRERPAKPVDGLLAAIRMYVQANFFRVRCISQVYC